MNHEQQQRDPPKDPLAVCPHVKQTPSSLPASLSKKIVCVYREKELKVVSSRTRWRDCRKEGGGDWDALSPLLRLTRCQIRAHPRLRNVIGKKCVFPTPCIPTPLIITSEL